MSARAERNDPMGTLLMDILEYFVRAGRERVFTRTLAERLNLCEERPWKVLARGKTVTGQWLAQQLQGYGIRPKTMRIEEDRAMGYELEDFREAFQRDIPRAEIEAFKTELREQVARPKEQTQAGGSSRQMYGSVMASNYNSRPLAAEVLVNGKKAVLVSRRQALKQNWVDDSSNDG